MSQELGEAPPNFGDDDENTTDNSMFVSAISPGTVDISLSGADDDDDDDESPFGAAPVRQKTPTNTTNTVESTVDDDDDEDPFGTKKSSNNTPSSSSVPAQVVPEPQSPSGKKQESHLYSPDSPRPTTTFDSQISSSTPNSKSNSGEATTTTSKPVQKRSSEDTIEITVSDPAKVGEVSLIFILLFLFLNIILGYVIIYDLSYNNKNNIINI
jgi:hypothetical protein